MGFTYENVMNTLPQVCTQDSTNKAIDYME